jgi:CheY-like chemotaxis protein
VESEVGQGSTFHFTVPFAVARRERMHVPAETVRNARVLVVDDNATNRRILEEMLCHLQMQPATASCVREALEALRHAAREGRPFDLVLTDANMPEVDGFTLAETINSDRRLAGTVVMMLTSGDRPGDISRCERAGVAAYLLKPIKQSELHDALMTALGVQAVRPREGAAREEQRSPPQRPLRILLAEDSLVGQKLAIGILEKRGHSVTVANNGREAVAAVQSQHFDLVLMDVQMPEMDGIEATAAIRALEASSGRHLPIIAMTAHAMKGDRERFLGAGMDDYIAKPVRAKQLWDIIEQQVAKWTPTLLNCGVRAETGCGAVQAGNGEYQAGSGS